jgi:hypothetical protein
VGTWTAYALDRKVVNEQMPNGGSYEEEMKGKECVVGTPSWGNPKVWEGVEYVEECLVERCWDEEHRGRRKG